jgi:hypothetical protein
MRRLELTGHEVVGSEIYLSYRVLPRDGSAGARG